MMPFKGRADLVAHVGQELALGPGGGLGGLLGLAHGGLGLLLGVDVGVHADPLPDPAPLAQDGDGPDEHVPVLAVVAAQPVLDLVDASGPATAADQTRAVFARSSGWTASSQPQPLSWSNVWPVNALQPGCSASNSPDAGVFQTIATVASIRDRNRSSPWRRASSARFARGDVPGDAEGADDAAVLVAERHLGRRDPGDLAAAPGLLLLLADHGLLGLHDGPLVVPRLAGVLLGEEVEIRLAHHLGRVAQAEPVGQGLVDADEAALGILEVDRVRDGVHERVEQVTFLADRLLRLLALHELAELAADGGQHLRAGPSSGCWISPLKTSMTPRMSLPTTIGKASAPCSPARAAAWRPREVGVRRRRPGSRPVGRSPRRGPAGRRRGRTWSAGSGPRIPPPATTASATRRRSAARRPAGRPTTWAPTDQPRPSQIACKIPGTASSSPGDSARTRDRRVLDSQAPLRPPSPAVHAVERRRVPPDQRRQDDDVGEHEQRQPHHPIQHPPCWPSQLDPAHDARGSGSPRAAAAAP